MKVIKQIIDYFESRGVLSNAQIQALRRSGFIIDTPDDYYNYSSTLDYEYYYDLLRDEGQPCRDCSIDYACTIADKICHLEKHTVGKHGSSRKRKRTVFHKGNVVKAGEICKRLEELMPDWSEPLRAMVKLSEYFVGPNALEEIPAELSPFTPLLLCKDLVQVLKGDELSSRGLCEALKDDALSWHELWDALSFEGYHDVLTQKDRGPAVTAYRKILAVQEDTYGGRYAWLLREREISWVCDLIRVQRGLLAQCRNLCDPHSTNFKWLCRWLSDSPHQASYWPFVILQHARRFDSRHPAEGLMERLPVPTYFSPAALDKGSWLRAWTLALIIDPILVMRIFHVFWDLGWIASEEFWLSLSAHHRADNGVIPD